jgi:hypothetical protein
LQAEADKDVPPGMIRMSEDERLKTIEMLKQNKSSVEEEYRKLPFRIETPSQVCIFFFKFMLVSWSDLTNLILYHE